MSECSPFGTALEARVNNKANLRDKCAASNIQIYTSAIRSIKLLIQDGMEARLPISTRTSLRLGNDQRVDRSARSKYLR